MKNKAASVNATLKKLGARIKQRRISINMTQAELARSCGISTSTLTRIENGVDSIMSNYIRILSALKLADNFDVLVPEQQPDYKALYENKSPRQRVRPGIRRPVTKWVWGEDEE